MGNLATQGDRSLPNHEGREPAVDGGTVHDSNNVVEMPRAHVDLGSFPSRDEGANVQVEPRAKSTTYGLKQIDAADLATYPTLREVLERIGELTEHIRKDTGLSLDLSKVSFDVCPAHEFAIRALKDGAARCGLAPEGIDEALNKTHPEHRAVMKQLNLSKALALGVFLPTEESVVLNGDLLSRGNANNLAKVLYHELIHVAQYQNFPGFFEEIGLYAKRLVELSNKGLKTSPEYLDIKDSVGAFMQLLEGMPTLLQTKQGKEYFPGASDGLGFFYKAWALSQTLFTREGWKTAIKYIGGALKYGALQKVSPHIDHVAYQVPELALLAGKARGEVVINLPHGITAEKIQQVAAVAGIFTSVNPSSKVTCTLVRRSSAQGHSEDVENSSPIRTILNAYADHLASKTPPSSDNSAVIGHTFRGRV